MRITQGVLGALIMQMPHFHLLELDGIKDSRTGQRLGQIELYKRVPQFHTFGQGFSGILSDTAMFRVMKFDFPEIHRSGSAVIFRDFENDGEVEEHFAGWVKPDREDDVKKWVDEMNDHLSYLLEIKHTK